MPAYPRSRIPRCSRSNSPEFFATKFSNLNPDATNTSRPLPPIKSPVLQVFTQNGDLIGAKSATRQPQTARGRSPQVTASTSVVPNHEDHLAVPPRGPGGRLIRHGGQNPGEEFRPKAPSGPDAPMTGW